LTSLARILGSVERNRDRPFLVDGSSGRTLTFGETREAALRIGSLLADHGVVRGARLAVDLPNSVELAVTYLGALFAGVVVIPIGSGFGRRELRSILERATPRAVAATSSETRVRGLAASPVELLTIGGAGFDPLAASSQPARQPDGETSPDDVVAIHFTSGTTGPPRGVVHRLRDFVGNADRFGDAMGIDETNRFYATLPMTYMAGYYNLLLLPLVRGSSVIVHRSFDARSVLDYWEVAEAREANSLWLVPTIMAMLLAGERDSRGPHFCRERVRLAISGTAPLDASLRTRFEETFGVTVHDSYGLSETLLSVTSTPSRTAPPGTVGWPLDGVAVRVAAAGGADGRLQLATPELMAGYLERADGNQLDLTTSTADGWFDTGDVARIGADGLVTITGRAKELIIRGGVNVSPVGVEQALSLHPDVERATVVGVPHEILGEEIVAVVSLRDDAALEDVEPALRAHAKEHLHAAQTPDTYLQIDDVPLTPTGKVRKAALRDIVVDHLGLGAAAKTFRIVDAADAPPAGGRVIDLTHPVCEGMLTFPGLNHPRVEVTQLARHAVEGRETRRLVLGTHTGTHLDAPLHFVPGGRSIDEIDLDLLAGPAAIADLTDVGPLEEVGAERLAAALGAPLRHPRVLLRFDWSRRWGGLDYYTDAPYLSEAACRWLLDHGVRLLGMDTPSPDDPRAAYGTQSDSPNHKLLLGAGVYLVEYLTDLHRLGGRETFLVALPLKVTGGDGAPARVVAIEP